MLLQSGSYHMLCSTLLISLIVDNFISFENNDFNQLFEHASPWAAEFLKGWDLHMNERKLWWRYRLHSLESVKFLGVSLIANYGGSLPDPVSGTKLCTKQPTIPSFY